MLNIFTDSYSLFNLNYSLPYCLILSSSLILTYFYYIIDGYYVAVTVDGYYVAVTVDGYYYYYYVAVVVTVVVVVVVFIDDII